MERVRSGCLVLILTIMVVIFALSASFLLAKAGEPQSHWLWCTVLRAC